MPEHWSARVQLVTIIPGGRVTFYQAALCITPPSYIPSTTPVNQKKQCSECKNGKEKEHPGLACVATAGFLAIGKKLL